MDVAPVESDAAAAAPESKIRTRQTDSLVEEATRVANTLNDKLPTLSQEMRAPDKQGAAPRQPPERQPQSSALEEHKAESFVGGHTSQLSEREEHASEAREPAVATAAPSPEGEVRGGRVRRASASVGASVGENLRPRVEKVREASSVIFDEAADDPGLRFVIVAALLFLLFLFILLFSYILG